ncbi:MAG: 16S rRNA (guanine(527)-N(7))-methyltransferase RsmG [Clostridia bacterium]|nr:16S rRNA (guanine(527)-N(7))-methyltransferase RsmG [Clostridia bacterium]
MKTLFKNLASELKIELTDEQINRFFKYKKLLVETNKYMNLTTITEDRDIILKHFIDSLTINQYIENEKKLIDVGTGAGFPGVPIKIIRDDVEITLLDSLNKRLNFLNTVIDELKLKKINTIHGRAEDVAHFNEYREQFDYVTARAVANLATLSELCIPFLKVGGIFICMKANIEEEIENAKNAVKILGAEIIAIDQCILPESNIERNIILIKKVKNTLSNYPRKAGLPAKFPLK